MKRYRLKYAGGMGLFALIFILSLTVLLIPVAVVILIDHIEIIEL